MVRLGDYIDITNGYAFKSSSYVDKGIRVMRITNVQKGRITDESPKYYPEETKNELGKYLINEGEILMSLTGNVGRVGRLPAAYLPAYVNQRVCKINISNSALSDEYLYYVLNSDVFERDAVNNSAGVAQLNLSTKWIEEYQIPLPRLEEQKKIASILDAADALRQKDKALIAKYDELTQSLFLDMFGDPVSNPMGWDVLKMEKVCSKVTDGTHDTPERLTEGVKFITGKHIRPFSIDYLNSDYVTEQVHKEIYRRCNPEKGDVLYTNIGVNLATAALNVVDYEFSMKNVALLKPKSDLLTGSYLEHFLNSANMKAKIVWMTSIGGAQQFLSLTEIRRLNVTVPEIHLQNRFAERVRAITDQKAIAYTGIKKSGALFNGLLQKAFKGELTN